jgi:hypothetical protein
VTTFDSGRWSRRRVLRLGGATLALLGLARTVRADEPPRERTAGLPGALTPEQEKLLADARFVYIQSTRKDGTLGKPAEIWFAVMEGALWVGSAPTSWRVKRIRWGRPQAKIAIGGTGGPTFRALGAIVKDAALAKKFCDQLAIRYPAQWPRWEKSFREGLASGERVLIRYAPTPG